MIQGRRQGGHFVQVRAAVGRGGGSGAAARVPARAGRPGRPEAHVGAAGEAGRSVRASPADCPVVVPSVSVERNMFGKE